MKLLLTGFEPFGGSPVNPSEQVVRAVERQGLENIQLQTAILPVDRVAGPAALIRAVQRSKPDAVLCLGEASRRAAISIERIAVNLMDYRIADNAGHRIVDEPIVRDGPAAFFVTLPVRAMLDAVCAAGVPAELSLSAGSFLCNQVIYTLLHYVAENNPKIPAGFIHLPPLPEQVVGKDPPVACMALETMVAGIRAAIGAIRVEWSGEFSLAPALIQDT
jgi:pyroglutamyl-peptidase